MGYGRLGSKVELFPSFAPNGQQGRPSPGSHFKTAAAFDWAVLRNVQSTRRTVFHASPAGIDVLWGLDTIYYLVFSVKSWLPVRQKKHLPQFAHSV